MHIRSRRRPTAVVLAVGAAAALALSGCTASGSSGGHEEGALLTVPREDTASFTPNFNPFVPDPSPFTEQAVYESLFVQNPVDGEITPWLAESWEVPADATGVTFHLRDDVTWSDGEPLTAEDVVYTFELSQDILGSFTYVSDVSAPDDTTVVFTFSAPNSPAVYDVAKEPIVPKHVWETFDDPATETNPDPVGTGPYTEVANFGAQSFDLLPNPEYWQPEKQKIAGIRVLAFAGNDGANLAAANGEVDWAPQFIPNIQESFVAKDPEHRHYWFPGTGAMIHWPLNTTKAPFDDADVRKALSMAVDREQVTEIGMMGYAHPADCTGLSDNLEIWKDDAVVDACDWTTLDVDAANALLDEAGYPEGADGIRTLKDGSPFAFDISVGATSSDWLSVAQHHRPEPEGQSACRRPSTRPTGAGGGGLRAGHVRDRDRLERQRPHAVRVTTATAMGSDTRQAGRRAGLRQLPPLRPTRAPTQLLAAVRRRRRRGDAAGALRPAAGTVLRALARGAALPRSRVGGVQRHPLRRLAERGQPLRDADDALAGHRARAHVARAGRVTGPAAGGGCRGIRRDIRPLTPPPVQPLHTKGGAEMAYVLRRRRLLPHRLLGVAHPQLPPPAPHARRSGHPHVRAVARADDQ